MKTLKTLKTILMNAAKLALCLFCRSTVLTEMLFDTDADADE